MFSSAAYLAVQVQAAGSGHYEDYSRWWADSAIQFGDTKFRFITGCYGFDGVSKTTCEAQLQLPGQPIQILANYGRNFESTMVIPIGLLGIRSNHFFVIGNFTVNTQIHSGAPSGNRFGNVDYLNTSLGGFRLLDSSMQDLNANFTSESGHDYSQRLAQTAVPEPSTIYLTALTVIAMGLKLRRSS